VARGRGDAELNALFVTGKFAYRRIGGRFDLAPELLDLYDGERCKGADKETSKQVLEMARQFEFTCHCRLPQRDWKDG
jgi:hypothetical protein